MKKLLFWRRMHGCGGLIQWQRIFPFESEAVMGDILNRIQNSSFLPTLVTLKISQEYSSAVLGFCLPGWNLAIDFRANQPGLRKFLQELDVSVLTAGGRPYLIKDDYLSKSEFELFYPEAIQLKGNHLKDSRPNWISNKQLIRLGLLDQSKS
jgi:decaprenylphospho-beta-D-ribofuranose 2-oxidase